MVRGSIRGGRRRGEEAFQEKVSYEKCFSEVGALK